MTTIHSLRSSVLWLYVQLIALAMVAVLSTGCAGLGKSLRNFITGKDANSAANRSPLGATRFSETDNFRAPADRQYKRMNRQKLEEEAELKADAGSLWVMEGQGAYLFSQNQIRMVGDLLNVNIEGSPKSQLQTKVRVISRLLEKLESPSRGLAAQSSPVGGQPQAGAPAGADPANQAPPAGQQNGQPNNGQNQQANAQNPNGSGAGAEGDVVRKDEPPFAVASVPTRIVEQLKDGSYRVRGMQPFMIGKREYKVIVTGIIRAEDFDDNGVDASKLLDPQFDIVSSRKGAAL